MPEPCRLASMCFNGVWVLASDSGPGLDGIQSIRFRIALTLLRLATGLSGRMLLAWLLYVVVHVREAAEADRNTPTSHCGGNRVIFFWLA